MLVRDGREEQALSALRGAIALGRVDVARLERDDTWRPLRSHPEWAALVEQARRAEPLRTRP